MITRSYIQIPFFVINFFSDNKNNKLPTYTYNSNFFSDNKNNTLLTYTYNLNIHHSKRISSKDNVTKNTDFLFSYFEKSKTVFKRTKQTKSYCFKAQILHKMTFDIASKLKSSIKRHLTLLPVKVKEGVFTFQPVRNHFRAKLGEHGFCLFSIFVVIALNINWNLPINTTSCFFPTLFLSLQQWTFLPRMSLSLSILQFRYNYLNWWALGHYLIIVLEKKHAS